MITQTANPTTATAVLCWRADPDAPPGSDSVCSLPHGHAGPCEFVDAADVRALGVDRRRPVLVFNAKKHPHAHGVVVARGVSSIEDVHWVEQVAADIAQRTCLCGECAAECKRSGAEARSGVVA